MLISSLIHSGTISTPWLCTHITLPLLSSVYMGRMLVPSYKKRQSTPQLSISCLRRLKHRILACLTKGGTASHRASASSRAPCSSHWPPVWFHANEMAAHSVHPHQASVFSQQAPTHSCLLAAQHQTVKRLVDTALQLAAKEPDVSLRGWGSPRRAKKGSTYWTWSHQHN